MKTVDAKLIARKGSADFAGPSKRAGETGGGFSP
jgi:hypothetical protein